MDNDNLDALNSMMLLDNFTAEKMADMAPYKSATNLKAIRQLSPDMIQSKPVVANFANYMSKPSQPIQTPEQELFMNQMTG